MFRFVVICGCLVAIAEAGFIGGGGLIYGSSEFNDLQNARVLVQQQPTLLALRPSIITGATASSSSNIVRGIAPLTSVLLGGRNNFAADNGQQSGSRTFSDDRLDGGFSANDRYNANNGNSGAFVGYA